MLSVNVIGVLGEADATMIAPGLAGDTTANGAAGITGITSTAMVTGTATNGLLLPKPRSMQQQLLQQQQQEQDSKRQAAEVKAVSQPAAKVSVDDALNFDTGDSREKRFSNQFIPVKILGSGSFGRVVQATEIRTQQDFAVKVISKNNVSFDEIDSLRRESVILSSLCHKNIVRFDRMFESETKIFIVMELMKGGTLRQLMHARKKSKKWFTEAEAAQIMGAIISAVAYFHSQSIVHRDLKPDNILVGDKNDLSSMKVADFGLSAGFEAKKSIFFTQRCGTLIYMAPEFFIQRSYSKPIDIWSCAIILFQLLHEGIHPLFDPLTDDSSSFRKKIKESPQIICPPHFSDSAKSLISKMTLLDQSERYSANQALVHPWVTQNPDDDEPLTMIQMLSSMNNQTTLSNIQKVIFFLMLMKSKESSAPPLPTPYVEKIKRFSVKKRLTGRSAAMKAGIYTEEYLTKVLNLKHVVKFTNSYLSDDDDDEKSNQHNNNNQSDEDNDDDNYDEFKECLEIPTNRKANTAVTAGQQPLGLNEKQLSIESQQSPSIQGIPVATNGELDDSMTTTLSSSPLLHYTKKQHQLSQQQNHHRLHLQRFSYSTRKNPSLNLSVEHHHHHQHKTPNTQPHQNQNDMSPLKLSDKPTQIIKPLPSPSLNHQNDPTNQFSIKVMNREDLIKRINQDKSTKQESKSLHQKIVPSAPSATSSAAANSHSPEQVPSSQLIQQQESPQSPSQVPYQQQRKYVARGQTQSKSLRQVTPCYTDSPEKQYPNTNNHARQSTVRTLPQPQTPQTPITDQKTQYSPIRSFTALQDQSHPSPQSSKQLPQLDHVGSLQSQYSSEQASSPLIPSQPQLSCTSQSPRSNSNITNNNNNSTSPTKQRKKLRESSLRFQPSAFLGQSQSFQQNQFQLPAAVSASGNPPQQQQQQQQQHQQSPPQQQQFQLHSQLLQRQPYQTQPEESRARSSLNSNSEAMPTKKRPPGISITMGISQANGTTLEKLPNAQESLVTSILNQNKLNINMNNQSPSNKHNAYAYLPQKKDFLPALNLYTGHPMTSSSQLSQQQSSQLPSFQPQQSVQLPATVSTVSTVAAAAAVAPAGLNVNATNQQSPVKQSQPNTPGQSSNQKRRSVTFDQRTVIRAIVVRVPGVPLFIKEQPATEAMQQQQQQQQQIEPNSAAQSKQITPNKVTLKFQPFQNNKKRIS